MKKTRLILTALLALSLSSILFPFRSYAQLDEREPGLYTIVNGESRKLSYSTTSQTPSSFSVHFFGIDKDYRAYRFRGGTSGVEASDTFILVVDPEKGSGVISGSRFEAFLRNMTPDDLIILPLLSFENCRDLRTNPVRAVGPINYSSPMFGMDYEWKQISDNSFEIRVLGLLPGEYGIATRMSSISKYDVWALHCFTAPGMVQLDKIAGRYFNVSTRIAPFESIKLNDKEKTAKPDFLLDISDVDTLVTYQNVINSLGFLLADYGIRTLYEMPTDDYKHVINQLGDVAEYTVKEYLTKRKEFVLSDIFREHYLQYKAGFGVAVFWMIQSAILNETAYIIANNPELFASKISEEQADAFLTLLKCRDESLAILSERNDYMKIILETTRLPLDDNLQKPFDYFTKYKDSIINVRNAMLK